MLVENEDGVLVSDYGMTPVRGEDLHHVVYGDSVAGDSMVVVTGGIEVPIESLFTQVKDMVGGKEYDFPITEVLTYDVQTKSSVYRNVKYIMRHSVNKKMYRVWLTNTEFIDVTEDHSLMGYVNTNNRRVGEPYLVEVKPEELGGRIKSLVRVKTLPYTSSNDVELEDVMFEFLGLVMGDGSAGKINEGIRLSTGNDDMDEIVTKVIQPIIELGYATSWHKRANGHDLTICGTKAFRIVKEWLYENGTKGISERLKFCTQKQIAAFLRGLMTADGTAVIRGNSPIVRLTTVSMDTAKVVTSLFNRIGIAASYFTELNENSYNGVFSGTYSKHIHVKSMDVYRDRVGFILNRKWDRIKNVKVRNHVDGEDFVLQRVYKIEEIDAPEYVYDIEVEDTHTFFANNILVHNTDSCYCTMEPFLKKHGIEPTKENCVELADAFGAVLNEHMHEFISDSFIIPEKRAKFNEAGREVVFRKALFSDVKKRYALHVVKDEKKDVDKLKVVGMETKRSDTPKIIQEFLEDCLIKVVKEDWEYEELKQLVKEYREQHFQGLEPWERGSPCGVKDLAVNAKILAAYENALDEGYYDIKKPKIHYSVKAAINTNTLITRFDEKDMDFIRDGDKIEILYLLPNNHGVDSVCRKVGDPYLPDWFKELPFDEERMEAKLIDKKLENIFGILGWSFVPPKNTYEEVFEEYDFFA